MKSFKRYVKESLALGTGAGNTTAFSSDAGGGSPSGHPVDGISSDDIVSNVSQKGDGKKVNVGVLTVIARAIQDKSIIKDDETGSLRYRTFGGEYMNSPYAAVARSEREIADVAAGHPSPLWRSGCPSWPPACRRRAAWRVAAPPLPRTRAPSLPFRGRYRNATPCWAGTSRPCRPGCRAAPP